MARGKSEDKHNAIIAAATRVFADKGLGGPVAAITSAAGVAEGTLFTYFKSKDDLINAVYCDIKSDMADAMMSGFPRRTSVKNRLRHVWDQYVNWGISNPVQHQAFRLIAVWSGLTKESKAAGSAAFTEVQVLAADATAQHLLKELPHPFLGAAMNALAEMTIDLIGQDSEHAQKYLDAGFEMLWSGLQNKK